MSEKGQTASEPVTGGCACGAVRYRIVEAPSCVCNCHCTLCRRASGAPMVTWLTVRRPAFTITRGQLRIRASSPQAERGFCADCGSPITFAAEWEPETLDVTLGTLDDPAALTPQFEVWTAERLPWLHLAADLPQFAAGSDGAGDS